MDDKSTCYCSKEELKKNSKTPFRVMETEDSVYREIARIMADTIIKNNGEQTVIICPVGPIAQYPYFVDIVNSENISLKNCIFINLDEYLDENDLFKVYLYFDWQWASCVKQNSMM